MSKSPGKYLALLAALLFILVGCSPSNPNLIASGRRNDTAFASPSQLTAALTNRNNVILHWKNNATTQGGSWIEYTTPGSEYIKLDAFTDTDATFFLHPALAPRTTMLYHLQPFFGRSTGPVEITTGNASSNRVPAFADGPIDPTNAVVTSEKMPKYSIRTMETFSKAAPSDLTATLSSPTSIDLHWKNHASDADGYLLEVAARAEGDFFVCALLPPDKTSFRKTRLPPETKCYFRVRAFFYGQPSEPVSITIPPQ